MQKIGFLWTFFRDRVLRYPPQGLAKGKAHETSRNLGDEFVFMLNNKYKGI